MIQVKIIERKKSIIYLERSFGILLLIILGVILLDYFSSTLAKSLIAILLLTGSFSLFILRIVKRSNTVGKILFDNENFHISLANSYQTYDYESIGRIDFNNYEGQYYYALKDMHPFYDGLGNYIYINHLPKKLELKIESKYTFSLLEKHFTALQKQIPNSEWNIKLKR